MTHFPFVSPHGSWDLSNWQRAKTKDVIKAKDYQKLSRDIPATESWALVAFFHSPRNPPGGLRLIWKKINHGAASILHMFTLFLGLYDLYEIVFICCFYAYKTNLQTFKINCCPKAIPSFSCTSYWLTISIINLQYRLGTLKANVISMHK